MSIEAYSILKNGNKKLSEHFKVREFGCKDGSDPVFIDSGGAVGEDPGPF